MKKAGSKEGYIICPADGKEYREKVTCPGITCKECKSQEEKYESKVPKKSKKKPKVTKKKQRGKSSTDTSGKTYKPVLNLQGMDPRLQLLHITSVMCFPLKKDIEKRRSWFLRSLLSIAGTEYLEMIKMTPDKEKEASSIVAQWLNDAIYPIGGWYQLAYYAVGPGQKKSPAQEVIDIIKQGKIAGLVLQGIHQDNELNNENDEKGNKGSVQKSAEFIASNAMKELLEKRGKLHFHQTPKNIQNKIWLRFKDAAHLWAAFYLSKNHKPTENLHPVLPLEQFEFGGLEGFLSLAEEFREWGELNMPPTGERKPFLNKDTAWKVNI